MGISQKQFQPIHTTVRHLAFQEEGVVEVIKSDKINLFDENTYAKLVDRNFHNGTISVKVYSQLLPDAPDFARGFIGLAYRIAADDTMFESFYIRPTNGRVDDPIRLNRACQYFAYPTYTFDYFRERGIADYEAPADIGLGEWIDLKAVIKDDKADFFVNNQLVLSVSNMKNGALSVGNIGLFVDIGTRGYFKDLEIQYDD